MSTTPNLTLPLMETGQAQKEVTFNQVAVIIDVLEGGIIDRDLATPPGSPSEGDAYIVAATATGVWATHENDIAYYFGGVWNFLSPDVGIGRNQWLLDEELFVQYFPGSDGFWDIASTSDAARIIYSPGGETDWGAPVPDNVADALDILAAGGLGGGSSAAYDLPISYAGGPPTSSEIISAMVVPRAVNLSADFAGSYGYIGTNPTASFVISVQDDGVEIGTVTISTSGGFSFATVSGTAKVIAAGSRIEFVAPATTDATAAYILATLAGLAS